MRLRNFLLSFLFIYPFGLSPCASANEAELNVKEPVAASVVEESSMIANGQGISSPSFWNGLNGENPAGLVLNQTIKLKADAGSQSGVFGSLDHSPSNSLSYGSGTVLIGNGLLGAGLEFRNYGNLHGGNGVGKINWGIAGTIQSISASFGLSSHTLLTGVDTTFDAGLMFEPHQKVRIAFMIPNVTGEINTFAGGVTYHANEEFDLVVDADYYSVLSLGGMKPGITYHSNRFEVAASYGFAFGASDVVLSRGLTAGLGVRIFEPLLLNYEYHGKATDHRLGLTIRFN